MKAGWELKTLEQIATTFGRGKSKHRPRNDANLYGGEYPFIQTGDVRNADHFISEYSQTYSEAGLAQSKLWPKGTICITIAANIAETGILGFDACFPDSVIGVVPNPAEAEVGYVEYLLQSFKVRIQALGQGSAQANINMGTFEGERFPFPCVAEQKRIVTLLDEAFDGIATARAHAEKNLQNARAIFESHLQSVFTQRGDGWQDKTLEQISTIFGRGKSRHRPRNEPKLYGGKYPFIQTGDIRSAGHFITEYSQTYSDLGLAQSKLWPKGTICITIAANIAETGILGFDACFPDSVIGVVPNPAEAEVGFVEYLLQSFKVRIQALGQGSAQANINMGTFENERFPFPSVAEQRHIVAKLDDLSEETQRLESLYQRKLTALDELKKSLLAQAFSGAL